MNRIPALLIVALIVAASTYSVQAQQPSPSASQPTENVPEVNYHLTVMMPQYRFLDTSGYGGRVGEYDSCNNRWVVICPLTTSAFRNT